MTLEERLTQIICEARCDGDEGSGACPWRRHGRCFAIEKLSMCQVRAIAEQLIKGGVTVPPCKVGDTVYQTDGEKIYKLTVRGVIYNTDAIGFDERAIGKSVFLTREEAERVMSGEDSGGEDCEQ